MMKYKSFLVPQHGSVDVIKIIEKDLRPPADGEARIRILASPVCQDDIAIRIGNRPFMPKFPFVPGYAFIGTVESIGGNVRNVNVGDRVAALTNYDSHAEYIYWQADQLGHVPETIDLAEASTLLLNYLVAQQIMYRVVMVKPGDKVLLIGSSGGVGTAFLQLGKLAGLKMYGLASPSKHATLAEYGAVPIDYHTEDFVKVLNQAEPGGTDYVFNGMDEKYFERGLAVLHRGGVLVHYGGPQSMGGFLRLVVKLIGYNLLPNGKKIKGYGTHREDVEIFKQDWGRLFRLLEEGKIKPVIQQTYPILSAIKAYEELESGRVTGNLVLLAPEMMQSSRNDQTTKI
jgi:NADPH:quinone reductase-like Zn-dependent oxidoreductase